MDNKSKIDEKSYYQKCKKYINRTHKYKQALEKQFYESMRYPII